MTACQNGLDYTSREMDWAAADIDIQFSAMNADWTAAPVQAPFIKPRLEFWQVWNMNFCFLGIQFGWDWFLNILPDLNQNDPDCARYLIQNSLWWVGVSGLDGIRLDTLP